MTLDAAVTAFVRAALPIPPARVLEIGAGAGELANVLMDGGYDMLAIDPAGESPAVRAVPLHELDEPAASFDAAVAVVSLHHVEPLAESMRRLGELLRPGGLLIVDEIDFERFDERAAAWWIEHRGTAGHATHSDPQALGADLRNHLHSVARIREALGEWFDLGEPVRGAYLYRWELPPGLREPEEELIAAGQLPATGARFLGKRR